MAKIEWQTDTLSNNKRKVMWATYDGALKAGNFIYIHMNNTVVEYPDDHESFKVLAGPFKTLKETQAVYLLLERLA